MRYSIIVFLAAIMVSQVAFSQETYLWPVRSKRTGEGILFAPQSYIGTECNATELIIAADLNEEIQSPVEGVVSAFHYSYQNSLTSCITYAIVPTEYMVDSIELAKQEISDFRYINAYLSIRTNTGKTVCISGLRPIRQFKTGERIKRGDIIGLAGFYYNKIKQTCVSVSISQAGKAADPMSPFGLKSTFQSPKMVCKTTLSREEAVEDYMILVDALKEGFPGLYDYVSEKEFDDLNLENLQSIPETMSLRYFESLLKSVIGSIKDGHTNLMNPSNDNPRATTVSFGIQDGKMFVTRTLPSDSRFLGKEIKAVDGLPCDSLSKIVERYYCCFDGFNESYKEFLNMSEADLVYCRNCLDASKAYDLFIEFSDGETRMFRGESINGKCVQMKPSWRTWYLTNLMRNSDCRMINDSIAYIGLKTFDLKQTEVEDIAGFIRKIVSLDIKYLIIDLRNNSGGSNEVLYKIYSFVASQPFRPAMYQMASKQGNYYCFRYSSNHCKEDVVFDDYNLSEDGDGYFLDISDQWIKPDTNVNYSNCLYVLTNERSMSAAAVFAGWVKRQNRGVIVGRETGSTYHQMKALTSVDLVLPNSNYIVEFPLVKIVFDTLVNEQFPFGKGVLPDFNIRLTCQEMASRDDSILDYTLKLISEGRYISTKMDDDSESDVSNVVAIEDNKQSGGFQNLVVLITAIILLTLLAIGFKHFKNTKLKNKQA